MAIAAITKIAVRARDGTILHIRQAGQPQGRAVLLLHGQATSGRVWEGLMNGPLAQQANLIAPDFRGHGHSGKPRRGYRDPTTWAADMAAVLEHFELHKPVLVGWSYGAAVACDYLRHGGSASGLALIAGGTEANIRDPQIRNSLTPEVLAAVRNRPRTSRRQFAERVVELLTSRPLEPSLRAALITDVLNVRPAAMLGVATRRYNNDDVLAAFSEPVLQIHGAQDRIRFPQAAERRTPLLRHGKTEIWPHCGHAPFLDDPDRFTDAIRDFLDHLP